MSENDSQKLTEIKNLLSGNPWDKDDDGLCGTIRALTNRMFSLEKLVWRFVWMGAGICTLGGLLLTIIGIVVEYRR